MDTQTASLKHAAGSMPAEARLLQNWAIALIDESLTMLEAQPSASHSPLWSRAHLF
jgi:hypothetical protein